MSDAVDQIVAAWGEVRPELDVWPTHVIGRVKRLARVLDRELKTFFARYGLEYWEVDVLTTLRRSGGADGLTAGALIKNTMVTSGAITNRIDRMQSRGLVRRTADPHDHRTVRIQLTDEGRALIDEIMPLHVDNEVRLLQGLSREESDQLGDLLRKLSESLGDTALE
ncbi:MarR family transcriptional regulator [Nocardia terpenica]|uniref:MarR family winged helix-turn-helix transcriptional regulator n=1 Tax=Nocardia terpenica TaxID=455432 RepID=UPI00189409FB|nr:MarR family transcriptional regulator [Nocardia terpenica]MBF6065091.1 MarR family transcriptional regulator [Nocardia terpenica]MBF6108148.1 MarR family transcriptional regulator [Nocardia terpenica]MBF6115363.1 MarR family transcriptional regulator [Nocardia terpenica]MBF6122685.1 MarR family transcriptional regulator [Nocardia terpenica]